MYVCMYKGEAYQHCSKLLPETWNECEVSESLRGYLSCLSLVSGEIAISRTLHLTFEFLVFVEIISIEILLS